MRGAPGTRRPSGSIRAICATRAEATRSAFLACRRAIVCTGPCTLSGTVGCGERRWIDPWPRRRPRACKRARDLGGYKALPPLSYSTGEEVCLADFLLREGGKHSSRRSRRRVAEGRDRRLRRTPGRAGSGSCSCSAPDRNERTSNIGVPRRTYNSGVWN